MTNEQLKAYLNEQVKQSARKVGDEKFSESDYLSLGRLNGLMAILQSMGSQSSLESLGLVGAFNDAYQQVGLIPPSQTLFSGLVSVLSDTNFESVTKGAGKLFVVEFSSRVKTKSNGTDLNASGRMDAIFEAVAKSFGNPKARFVRVEIALDGDLKDTLNPLTSARYKINHGPTIVFVRNGEEVGVQLVGQQTEDQLKSAIVERLNA